MKKIKFYSQEEINYLSPVINEEIKGSNEFYQKAAKKFNRTEASLKSFVLYRKNKLKGVKYVNVKKETVKERKSPNFKQGEFVIPINNWEIRTVDGVNQLVFKFGKQ